MRLRNPEFRKNIQIQTAMFIYKSKSLFHRFYEHSKLHIELETRLNSLFKLFGLHKNYSHI